MTLLLGVLVASLLGSVHCAGMCGGFVCLYSAGLAPGAGSRRAHAAYNIGRLMTYLVLGGTAGALGSAINSTGRAVGISRAAAIVAGILLVIYGGATALRLRGARLPARLSPAPARLVAPVAAAVRRLRDLSPVARALGTGIVTTLIPCGWLYTFVATAGGTGSTAGGMLVMFVFWAGTLPAMIAVGVGAQRALLPLTRRLPAFSAAMVVVLGLLSLTGRLHPLAIPRLSSGQAAHADH